MTSFSILLGGEFTPTPRAARQIAATRIIAADAGMRHAAALGVVPELWVGDFDSAPSDLPPDLLAVPREQFPMAKDHTDGELAVAKAIEGGATRLILVGAFGGPRADHAFLHLTLAMRLAESGKSVMLTSGNQEGIPLLKGTASFDYEDGTIFSVIAFEALSGLTLQGARWPLNQVTVPFGSSLTISNEVSGKLTISLGLGRAMLIAHPFPAADF
jgi:thiamine pyrophosphokinase